MGVRCHVCRGTHFGFNRVLWPELIAEWQLSEAEASYIDRQQGVFCASCGSNLRSMALAKAILESHGFPGCLLEFTASDPARSLRVLEINEAGSLSPVFARLPQHQLVTYPQVDMTRLPFGNGAFDLVVHSDTLEHVEFPVTALSECRRVLGDGGRCIFTAPIVVDRFTRSRAGLPASYHGAPATGRTDMLVCTEFGADIWKWVLQAGFDVVSMHCLEYPAGIAIEARVAGG
jgi:SAM-dependent methyltransferase